MKKNEEIKITEQEMLDFLKDKWKADTVDLLSNVIIHARKMNFPERTREGSLTRIMHGTEFLHGMLKGNIISNDLYQQLKRVAEDLTIEYEITI